MYFCKVHMPKSSFYLRGGGVARVGKWKTSMAKQKNSNEQMKYYHDGQKSSSYLAIRATKSGIVEMNLEL